MYTIEKKHYGLYITMGNLYSPDEIQTYLRVKERVLAELEGPFSIVVDLRSAIPPQGDDQILLEQSMSRLKRQGLVRMAIIFTSPVIKLRARQILFNAGVGDCTRTINAAKSPDWEELTLNWILYGIEPEVPAHSGHKPKLSV